MTSSVHNYTPLTFYGMMPKSLLGSFVLRFPNQERRKPCAKHVFYMPTMSLGLWLSHLPIIDHYAIPSEDLGTTDLLPDDIHEAIHRY